MDNNWLIVIVILIAYGLYQWNVKRSFIDYAKAQELLAAGAVVVDVRTREEYREGHIPGAKNLPLHRLDDLAKRNLPQKDQPIILYCRSGSRANQALRLLKKLGYTQLYNLGGIGRWHGEIE